MSGFAPPPRTAPPTGRLDSVTIIEVICVVFSRGRGIASDPIRLVTAYYTKDGDIIAEHDPIDPESE